MPKLSLNIAGGDSAASLNRFVNPVGSAIFIICALAGVEINVGSVTLPVAAATLPRKVRRLVMRVS